MLAPWQGAYSHLAACIVMEIPADPELVMDNARDRLKGATAEHNPIAFAGEEKQPMSLSTPQSRPAC